MIIKLLGFPEYVCFCPLARIINLSVGSERPTVYIETLRNLDRFLLNGGWGGVSRSGNNSSLPSNSVMPVVPPQLSSLMKICSLCQTRLAWLRSTQPEPQGLAKGQALDTQPGAFLLFRKSTGFLIWGLNLVVLRLRSSPVPFP